MTKEITLKYIDNQSHGYIQISKYNRSIGGGRRVVAVILDGLIAKTYEVFISHDNTSLTSVKGTY